MQVNITLINKKGFILDYDDTDLVEDVKRKIQEKEGIPSDRQRLIFAGKELNDDDLFSAYNPHKETCVHLIIKS